MTLTTRGGSTRCNRCFWRGAWSPRMRAFSIPVSGAGPVGTQNDAAYAGGATAHGVTNAFVTAQKTSCYTPEVPYFTSNGPNDGYTGMSPCGGASNTGEDLGPYPTQ